MAHRNIPSVESWVSLLVENNGGSLSVGVAGPTVGEILNATPCCYIEAPAQLIVQRYVG